MEHHLGLGLEPRFGKMVAVEDASDKPGEACVADNRLPLGGGDRDADKLFDELSQRLASATAGSATFPFNTPLEAGRRLEPWIVHIRIPIHERPSQ